MEPLAILLRPKNIDEVIGQKHLLGENKVIRNMVNNNKLFSMILYGKPGIGKTSIAISIVNTLNIKYRLLNAVINNKKDFDIVIEEAKMFGGMVIIMDEIHRLNKDKQDLLLPYLESGLITLIGLFLIINILIFNKTFFKNSYELDYMNNISIPIPRYSYYRGTGGMEAYTTKLKTIKQPDEVNILIDRYLNTLDKIECNNENYYYDKNKNFTIIQYRINNDGIGFVNTIYISYSDGNICK